MRNLFIEARDLVHLYVEPRLCVTLTLSVCVLPKVFGSFVVISYIRAESSFCFVTNKNVWKLSRNNFLKTLGSRLVFKLRFLCGFPYKVQRSRPLCNKPFKLSMFVAFLNCLVHVGFSFYLVCTLRCSRISYSVVISFYIIRPFTSQSGRVEGFKEFSFDRSFVPPHPCPKDRDGVIVKSVTSYDDPI